MYQYIILLSDLSYELGLIGLVEYEERRAIADWLSSSGNSSDPRIRKDEEDICAEEKDTEVPLSTPAAGASSGATSSSGDEDPDDWARLLAFNKWVFTPGDADCYPAVPHGHLYKKTNEWPKLNPYTGRVFSDMHVEDVSFRLTRSEMKLLWNDPDFVDHCRKQVLWYSEFAPRYSFPRARYGKLHFPRWR
jgi:hypothetical protein